MGHRKWEQQIFEKCKIESEKHQFENEIHDFDVKTSWILQKIFFERSGRRRVIGLFVSLIPCPLQDGRLGTVFGFFFKIEHCEIFTKFWENFVKINRNWSKYVSKSCFSSKYFDISYFNFSKFWFLNFWNLYNWCNSQGLSTIPSGIKSVNAITVPENKNMKTLSKI